MALGINRDAGEVLREALHLLVERDRFLHDSKQELGGKIQSALDEISNGEGITEAQLMQHIAERRKNFLSAE